MRTTAAWLYSSRPALVRRIYSRTAFLVVGMLLAGGWLSAADAGPVLVPDKNHPGYYKPFRCLSVDPGVGPAESGIRNNCGYEVEAYWRHANHRCRRLVSPLWGNIRGYPRLPAERIPG